MLGGTGSSGVAVLKDGSKSERGWFAANDKNKIQGSFTAFRMTT